MMGSVKTVIETASKVDVFKALTMVAVGVEGEAVEADVAIVTIDTRVGCLSTQ